MPLDHLTIYRLVTPLSRPYCLAFGAVSQFDSFIALARHADGSWRAGESTPLPGYSHETPELMDREYGLLARHGRLGGFLERNRDNPFVLAPVLTSLDPTLKRPVDGQVLLCPILQWDDPSEIAGHVALLAEQGHKVAKVKISRELEETQIIVRETIRAGEHYGLRFRYDANGDLDKAGAEVVVRWLDGETTELLEQPFAPDAWQGMASLYASCPVPLMLDESIVDARHVFLAAGCADYIKLKLAKNGSPARLLELIRQAREIGLKVILGNGVQGMVGCWLEGQVQVLAGLDNPGEMNGFRKIKDNFLGNLFNSTPAGFATGALLPWPELEALTKEHCLREYQIPIGTSFASCA